MADLVVNIAFDKAALEKALREGVDAWQAMNKAFRLQQMLDQKDIAIDLTCAGWPPKKEEPMVKPFPEWCRDYPMASGEALHCAKCGKDFIVRSGFVPYDSSFDGPGNGLVVWLSLVDSRHGGLSCPGCNSDAWLAATSRQPDPELFFSFGAGPPKS